MGINTVCDIVYSIITRECLLQKEPVSPYGFWITQPNFAFWVAACWTLIPRAWPGRWIVFGCRKLDTQHIITITI